MTTAERPADRPLDALAEPVERVGRGWTSALALANGAIWVGWYGPLQILLASQATDFAPDAGMSKETMLAWVTGAGAVVSLVANPFFGALSDRTVSAGAAAHRGSWPGRQAGHCRSCCWEGRAGCGPWRSAGAWSSSR